MNIKIDLPNPKTCYGCPCNLQDEGREFRSHDYWDWTDVERVWYNSVTEELSEDEPEVGTWTKVPRRPAKCVEELGE